MGFHPITFLWFSLLLLFLTTLLLIITSKLQLNRHKKKQLPPGPSGLPVIGNLHQLGALAHQSLWKLSKRYGPLMFLRLGGVPTLIASSADSAKELLKTHDHECCSRPLLVGTGRFSYNFLDVAFTPYGDYWREMRKLCVLELFSAKRVQSFGFVRQEEVDLMIKSISDQFSSSLTPVVVDLSEKLMSLTADITWRVASGKSFRERGGTDIERFREVLHEALTVLGSFSASDFFPYFGWIVDGLMGIHRKRERIFQELDAFYQRVIDDHLLAERSSEQQEDNIVDLLLNFERRGTESRPLQLTKNHIKAVLMNIFIAGVDTIGTTTIWFMAELARNPRVMKKVQEEIRNCVGSKGKVSETDIHQLSYFKMVMNEVFRLHPPGPLLLPRESISQFQINGYNIYPRTRIHVNLWAIGRDPNIWENPQEFFPERFINKSINFKGKHFELLPFSTGRRGCPGLLMATSTMELGLANLLYCFDWKLPIGVKEEDLNMEEAPGLTVHKKEKLKLVPIKYQFNSHQKIA